VLLVVAATEPELRGARDAATLLCGIGPVDAAVATARALAERHTDALLHVGIAGCGRGCGLEPGRIVLGSESIYCDADSLLVAARSEPDPRLLAAARRALPDAAVMPIGTSARVGGSSGCDVEAMEGFGVLRACALAGVPAVELRAVSNVTTESDRSKWSFDDAFDALAGAVERVVRSR
jgi:nucleoside phosphorylase